ncbi:hypothetical protein NCC49_005942 [Naganishia albida]|nr:hypothetical protein NCC49_005942 [Naganishia albida]
MTTLCITNIANWNPPPEVYRHLVETLDEPSRTRIVRYRQSLDRLRFLAGRLLLRRHLLRIDPSDTSPLQLDLNDFGKPILSDPRWHGLEFNISHEDEVVMLAVTSAAQTVPGIGIDVMRVNRSSRDAEGLEEVLLEQTHPSELATFRRTFGTADETLRLDYLIRMWTVKEAYTKAIGTGLGTEFAGR